MSCWRNLRCGLRLAVGSDEKRLLTDFVVEQLRKEGYQLELFGPLKGEPIGWPDVGERVAVEVSSGRADEGIVFCWTGNGVSIAANKVPGVRGALCNDAESARGARVWDGANVLAMSLRSISQGVAKEIPNAWFSSQPAKTGVDAELIERAKRLDSKYHTENLALPKIAPARYVSTPARSYLGACAFALAASLL